MITNIDALFAYICARLRTEVPNFAVVGMSAGADSTLVTLLCVKALGHKKVIGVHMPYGEYDYNTFNHNSREVAKILDIKSVAVPIGTAVDNLHAATGLALGKVNRGNMRARMRMAALYAVSHHYDGRVIGTGNLSEDFIGYDTKGGDALADIFPIGELLKSEVYELLEYFRDKGMIEDKHINRTPSAGLWEGQTDENELGHTYAEMEPAVKRFFEMTPEEERTWVNPSKEIDKFVLDRHFANKHKHEAPKVITGLRRYCE